MYVTYRLYKALQSNICYKKVNEVIAKSRHAARELKYDLLR